MRITQRLPAPNGSIFGKSVSVTSEGEVVRVGDRIVGRVLRTIVVEDGAAIEMTMEVDDDWAAQVGLGIQLGEWSAYGVTH